MPNNRLNWVIMCNCRKSTYPFTTFVVSRCLYSLTKNQLFIRHCRCHQGCELQESRELSTRQHVARTTSVQSSGMFSSALFGLVFRLLNYVRYLTPNPYSPMKLSFIISISPHEIGHCSYNACSVTFTCARRWSWTNSENRLFNYLFSNP